MEINLDQKTLIQSIDSELESAFADGVTQSGGFLPKLTGYDTIPTDLRPQGRNGIMSTFASLVKRLGLFRPTQNAVPLNSSFSAWPDPAFGPPTYITFPATGEIVLDGLFYSPVSMAAFSVVGNLPVEARPAKGIIVPVVHNGSVSGLRILTNGQIVTEFITSTNPISLSGIRFLPA